MYYGIHRFNGEDLLKNFMFVGDSLSHNQWQSLACMLHAAVPNSNHTFDGTRDRSVLSFPVGPLDHCPSIIMLCIYALHVYTLFLTFLCYELFELRVLEKQPLCVHELGVRSAYSLSSQTPPSWITCDILLLLEKGCLDVGGNRGLPSLPITILSVIQTLSHQRLFDLIEPGVLT